jgi:hypothetical protein
MFPIVRPRMLIRKSLVLVVAVTSSAAVVAQDQVARPTFKAAVGLVQLDVSVLDGKRQPIRGLQAADFTVLEDGKPRPIRLVEAIDVPPRPAATGVPLTADKRDALELADNGVSTNQIGNEDGRLVFILMDRTIPTGQPVTSAVFV